MNEKLLGGAIGFLLEYVSYSPDDTGFLVPSSAAEAGLWLATFFGGVGAITGLLFGAIHGDIEEFIFLENPESKKTVSLEISSIVEKTEEYIIVSYRGKVIRLIRSEYNSIVKTNKGKQLIVIPKSVYLRKFK